MTYDQGGNVFQWNDDVTSDSSRGFRGGSWSDGDSNNLRSGQRLYNVPTLHKFNLGFRLASVPEPSTIGLIALLGTGLLLWKRRKVTASDKLGA